MSVSRPNNKLGNLSSYGHTMLLSIVTSGEKQLHIYLRFLINRKDANGTYF